MAESAISSALRIVGSQVIEEANLLRGVPNQVEYIKTEFNAMQCFLKDADTKGSKGDNRVSNWVQEVRDVAYQAENVIGKIDWMQRWKNHNKGFLDTVLWYANVYPSNLKFLHNIGKEIEQIKNKIDEISKRKDRYCITNLEESSSDKGETSPSEDDLNIQRLVSPYFEFKDDFIGFANDIEKIVEELIDPSNKDLTFVSLVGMGGIGKSTLASKMFTDPKIQENFNTFAWISVSQSYQSVELLKDIMKQIMNITKENLRNEGTNGNEITEQELDNMSEKEVREKLHKFLKNKKYLIVLDDVWTNKALDQISHGNTIFPNSRNCSRIILTTRDLQVAKHTGCTSQIHELKVLDDIKSWEFLRNKALPLSKKFDQSILNELQNIGKKLARKCKGLPLALSVLGGFLSKNIDLNFWSNMVNSIDWGETNSEKNIVEILALSFHDLPHYLKSCFLYMAYFPEDHFISTTKLTKMWIAEGFIPFNSKCSQEETARKYINELVHRSMIQVVEMSKTYGWIKRIQMHDILRDFCIAESAKIGFLKIYNNHGDYEAFTSDSTITYRIAFNNYFRNGVYMENLRTLIGFDLTQPSFSGLNYLRVLELVDILNIEKLSDEIGNMIFLRYIGLKNCGDVKIPSSVKYLINLQTFDARDTRINSLPNSIWKIPTLKHVYMFLWNCNIISPKHDELQNVQTLHITLPFSNNVSKTREFIRTLENKSEISSLHLYHSFVPLETVTMLSRHCNVVELGLSGIPYYVPSVKTLPHYTLFPPNLRKLKLSHINLLEDPMPTIEMLTSLVVLHLGLDTYNGALMSCSSGGFRRLKYMLIEQLQLLETWEIEAGSMPKLSKLCLNHCINLHMQPTLEELVHLPALEELKLISVRDVPKETVDKLVEIGCKVMIIKDD